MIWEEMSINKYNFQGDPFRLNELCIDITDEDIYYYDYELDIIE